MVTAPTRTLFCNLIIMFLRTSASGDLKQLSFTAYPIHRWITCRIISLSVRHSRLTSSPWSSKHSTRATSSGRLELTPSSSRPTFLEFSVCWSWREDGGNGVWVFQPLKHRYPHLPSKKISKKIESGIRTLLGGPIRFRTSSVFRVLSCRPRIRPCRSCD
jgi:hypothetical protein